MSHSSTINFKGKLLAYAGWTAAGLAAVLAFNFVADPLYRWHPPYLEALRHWPDGGVLVIPEKDPFDDSLLTESMAKAVPAPDVLIVGNSKMLLADGKMFAPGVRIFNGRMSRAFVEDYVLIWRLFTARGAPPRRFIMLVDPYMFNKNASGFNRLTNYFLARSLIGEAGGGNRFLFRAGLGLFGGRGRRLLRNGVEMLRWEMLQASVGKMLRGRANPARPVFGFAREADLEADASAVRIDGSYILPASIDPHPTLEELRRAALDRVAKKDPSNNLGNFAVDENLLDALDALVDDAAKRGARVMILGAPTHKIIVDKWLSLPEEGSILPKFTAAIEARSQGNRRFDFCRAFDAEAAGCAETEFVSPEHFRRSCTEKFIVKCLRSFPQWRSLAP